MMEIKGTGHMDPAALSYFQDLAEKQWPQELARLQRLSLVSGIEVVYDLTMLNEDWSPAFRHDNDRPVAWVNSSTGERSEGPERPK